MNVPFHNTTWLCQLNHEPVLVDTAFGKFWHYPNDTEASGAIGFAHDANVVMHAFDYIIKKRGEHHDAPKRVLEFGAANGIMTIALAGYFYNATVLAVEPSPIQWTLLLRNIALHRCNRIQPIFGAVGTENGVALMRTQLECFGASGFQSEHWQYAIEREYVQSNAPVFAFDSLVEQIGGCDVLVMDCEGGEHEIIRKSTALRTIKYAFVELHERRKDVQMESYRLLKEQVPLSAVQFCGYCPLAEGVAVEYPQV